MKTMFRIMTAAVTLVCLAVPVRAQEGGAPVDMEAAMAEMAKLAAPGPMHDVFKKWEGTYDVKIMSWFGPGTEPVESHGTSTYRTIFGGRYMTQEFSGSFMGESFSGMGLVAYDNVRKEYISTWIDDMNTTILISRGQPDSTGNVITFHGTMDDPMTDRMDVPVREVAKIVDADTHTYSMYHPSPDGGEFMAMEITYTRKK